jgi:hypothetical protein
MAKLEDINKKIESLKEDITIPINIGDTILGGKFKNKKIIVKTIGKNEKGEVTINGKPLMRFRIIINQETTD